ncbi:hypothetical protein Tco_1401851 [Tanacetum coccineum]
MVVIFLKKRSIKVCWVVGNKLRRVCLVVAGLAEDERCQWFGRESSTDDESFLFDDKDEKIKDIPWKSTNDDESKDDDEEDESNDDKSIDIEKTNDERTNTNVEDQVNGVAEMNIAEEAEEENTERELKQADHSTSILASIRSQVPSVVEDYLGSSLPDALKKVLQSHTEELKKELSEKRDYKDVIEESIQANVINEVNNFLPKFLPQEVKESLEKTPPSLGQSSFQGQSAIQAAESLSECELKKILYGKMHKIQSHLTHDTYQELYDALTWSMLLDKLDKVLKKRDRGDDQDEDPSAGSNQGKKTKKTRFNESESSKKTSTTKESSKGKSPARTSKSGKSVTAKELVEEPIFEIASDNIKQTLDDKDGDASQLPHTDADVTQADAALNISKKDWFKKALRPETLDPDWNAVKTIDDTQEQSWFNEMIKRADLVGPVFNLLKGTCKSYVELEYNMEECYRALTDQLDWANPEGHKSLVDMSKPLPLQDKESRLIIPVEFFFNNDLKYLKAGNKERSYSSSITKTPAARYTLKGIEDMILTLWSPVIIAYDKDAAFEISHWGPQRQQYYRAMINQKAKK